MEKEPNKVVEEKTTVQPSSADEPKDTNLKPEEAGQSNQDGGEEPKIIVIDGVEYTEDQIKTTFKKAEDFENSIALKKLLKEKGGEAPKPEGGEAKPNSEDILKEAREAGRQGYLEERAKANESSLKGNLTIAYSDFVKENPWAANKLDEIGKHFTPGTSYDVESLKANLKLAAQQACPEEYVKHTEDKIKSKVLAGDANISAGDIGGDITQRNTNTPGGKKLNITEREYRFLQAMGKDPEKMTEDDIHKALGEKK